MLPLSKGLFFLFGFVFIGTATGVATINIVAYEGVTTGIDTIIYLGQDVPDATAKDVPGFAGLNAELIAFKEVCFNHLNQCRKQIGIMHIFILA